MKLSRNKIKKLYNSKNQSAKRIKKKKVNRHNFSKKRKGGKNLRAKTFKKKLRVRGGNTDKKQFHNHTLELDKLPDYIPNNIKKTDLEKALNGDKDSTDGEFDRYTSFKTYLLDNSNNLFNADFFTGNIKKLTDAVNNTKINVPNKTEAKNDITLNSKKFKAAILWDNSGEKLDTITNECKGENKEGENKEGENKEHESHFNFLIKDFSYNNLMHMASEIDPKKNNFFKSINYHTDGGMGGFGGSYEYADQHIFKMLLSKNKDCDTPLHKLFKKRKFKNIENIIYPHFNLDVYKGANIEEFEKQLKYEDKIEGKKYDIGNLNDGFISVIVKLIWGKKNKKKEKMNILTNMEMKYSDSRNEPEIKIDEHQKKKRKENFEKVMNQLKGRQEIINGGAPQEEEYLFLDSENETILQTLLKYQPEKENDKLHFKRCIAFLYYCMLNKGEYTIGNLNIYNDNKNIINQLLDVGFKFDCKHAFYFYNLIIDDNTPFESININEEGIKNKYIWIQGAYNTFFNSLDNTTESKKQELEKLVIKTIAYINKNKNDITKNQNAKIKDISESILNSINYIDGDSNNRVVFDLLKPELKEIMVDDGIITNKFYEKIDSTKYNILISDDNNDILKKIIMNTSKKYLMFYKEYSSKILEIGKSLNKKKKNITIGSIKISLQGLKDFLEKKEKKQIGQTGGNPPTLKELNILINDLKQQIDKKDVDVGIEKEDRDQILVDKEEFLPLLLKKLKSIVESENKEENKELQKILDNYKSIIDNSGKQNFLIYLKNIPAKFQTIKEKLEAVEEEKKLDDQISNETATGDGKVKVFDYLKGNKKAGEHEYSMNLVISFQDEKGNSINEFPLKLPRIIHSEIIRKKIGEKLVIKTPENIKDYNIHTDLSNNEIAISIGFDKIEEDKGEFKNIIRDINVWSKKKYFKETIEGLVESIEKNSSNEDDDEESIEIKEKAIEALKKIKNKNEHDKNSGKTPVLEVSDSSITPTTRVSGSDGSGSDGSGNNNTSVSTNVNSGTTPKRDGSGNIITPTGITPKPDSSTETPIPTGITPKDDGKKIIPPTPQTKITGDTVSDDDIPHLETPPSTPPSTPTGITPKPDGSTETPTPPTTPTNDGADGSTETPTPPTPTGTTQTPTNQIDEEIKKKIDKVKKYGSYGVNNNEKKRISGTYNRDEIKILETLPVFKENNIVFDTMTNVKTTFNNSGLLDSVNKSIIPYKSTNVEEFVDIMNEINIDKNKITTLKDKIEDTAMKLDLGYIIRSLENPIKEFNKNSSLIIFAFTKFQSQPNTIKVVDINNNGKVEMENAKYVAFILIDLVRENNNRPFKPQFRPITFDILENKIKEFTVEHYNNNKKLKEINLRQQKIKIGGTKKNKKRLGGTKKKTNYKKKNKSVKKGKRGKKEKRTTKKNKKTKN